MRRLLRVSLMIALSTMTLAAYVLAYFQADSLWVNHITKNETVERQCSAAISPWLLCFCYESFGRECPLDKPFTARQE